MRSKIIVLLIALFSLPGVALPPSEGSHTEDDGRKRIMVVSSYHREYLWSQDTGRGVNAALLDFKLLDTREQAALFLKDDYAESSVAVVKKLWMDTKRKNSKEEIANTLTLIMQEIKDFRPDIILLGDDNAANYIGNQFIDTSVPVVFWGINGLPLKYGLIDSIKRPGHNVTGVYQAGYLRECLEFLKRLLPELETFAILSDSSPTGRSKAKELIVLSDRGRLPLRLAGYVMTNSVSEWKKKALEFSRSADAFFVLNHNTLKDDGGNAVSQLELGAWYLKKIRKPDVGHERQFVVEGMLAAVDDSGYKQGYEATKLAYQILEEGRDPAEIPVYAPERGPFIVNLERAKMLGIEEVVSGSSLIDEVVEKSLALERFPGQGR